MATDRDDQRTKRELRLEIARLRRRLDRRARRVQTETRRLTSWKTYVRHFPIPSLGLAFGVGLIVASGWRFRMGRIVGTQVMRRAAKKLTNCFWSELEAFWIRTTPDKRADSAGRDADV